MLKSRWLNAAYATLLVALAALDQSTKFHSQKAFFVSQGTGGVQDWVADGHTVFRWGDVAGSWLRLDLTYVRNTGAIWGMLNDLPRGLSNAFFLLLYPVFMFVLGRTFRASHPGQRLLRLAIVLIFSGALGNFIDRVTLGYVIDWVHVQWRLWGWYYNYPVFNVADMAIVCGVILWFVDSLWESATLRKIRS